MAHDRRPVEVRRATAAARRLRVMVKPGYFEPCNLWAVAALPPCNRKSAVQSAATAPLIAWKRDQTTIMEPEIQARHQRAQDPGGPRRGKANKAAKEKDNGKAAELAREAANIEAELPDIPMPP